MEQQQDLPTSSEPADNNVSGGDHAEPRSDVQAPSDVPDLASQTANLHINDENSKPESTHDTTITTTSNDDSAQNAEGESTDSKLDVDTTAHTQKEQDTTVSTKEDDGINAGTSDGKTKDEYDTPRLATYIKLHNEMMTSKTALTSHTSEQLELYHKASHIAHTLLNSNEKHGDLPIVMHAHACLVLACSDEDDCYERMQEALKVVRYAMAEGALGKSEGEAMLKTCEEVMGMREFLFSDEEKIEGDGEADDEDDGESDENEEAEGEGEGEGDKVDGELERNDALP